MVGENDLTTLSYLHEPAGTVTNTFWHIWFSYLQLILVAMPASLNGFNVQIVLCSLIAWQHNVQIMILLNKKIACWLWYWLTWHEYICEQDLKWYLFTWCFQYCSKFGLEINASLFSSLVLHNLKMRFQEYNTIYTYCGKFYKLLNAKKIILSDVIFSVWDLCSFCFVFHYFFHRYCFGGNQSIYGNTSVWFWHYFCIQWCFNGENGSAYLCCCWRCFQNNEQVV